MLPAVFGLLEWNNQLKMLSLVRVSGGPALKPAMKCMNFPIVVFRGYAGFNMSFGWWTNPLKYLIYLILPAAFEVYQWSILSKIFSPARVADDPAFQPAMSCINFPTLVHSSYAVSSMSFGWCNNSSEYFHCYAQHSRNLLSRPFK